MSIDKAGNLVIKGSKTVDVDKNKQVMTLSGTLRPQDVSATDVAESTRIADAQLVYTAQGSLGKPKTGILTRVLGVVWP
jgi:flagellar L-ring protein precursor FlgH